MIQTREVEVKYRIHDIAQLESALSARGIRLSAPVDQSDQAYAQHGWRYGMSKVGVTFARLRTQKGRHVFTLKVPTDNEMACLEFETEVANWEQMHQAIQHMGYFPTVRIVKNRRSVRHRDMSLCVDHVQNLGDFLEVEKTVIGSISGQAVQVELHAFAVSLGVGLERETDTYDSLLRQVLLKVEN